MFCNEVCWTPVQGKSSLYYHEDKLSTHLIYLYLQLSNDIESNPRPDNEANIKIMHININGLRENLDSLFTERKQYDVIAVTESKLSDNVKTEDILLDEFEESLRKDRIEDQGGGITVYIKKGIITHKCHDLQLQNLESI